MGYRVAKSLSSEGHDVVVVESDVARAEQVENHQDVSVVQGNGARPAVLEKAGVLSPSDVDYLIACTNRDEVNLMAGWLAKRAGVGRVISRVRDLEFTDTPAWARELGIDVMSSPERSLSREIESLLTVNAALHSTDIFDGKAASYAFRVESDSPICGRSLSEIGARFPEMRAIVVYVERGEEHFVPSGQWVAQEGDLCFLVCPNPDVMTVQHLFHPGDQRRLRRVIIVGGGKLGANLVRRMIRRYPGLELVLVDSSHAKCVKLAGEFPDVQVLMGDGFDEAVLHDAGVNSADGLVVTTENDELNVMIGILGKKLGCSKTVAVVRKSVYSHMGSSLPVDVLLNPDETLAAIFLRHVRYPKSARALYLIDRIGAEMIEVTLQAENTVVGQAIMDLGLPRGVLIAMIFRAGETLVPNGSTVLCAGDVISLFATRGLMPRAVSFFEGQR